MLTTPELVWLLAAVAKGDQVAFERLYQATRAKLYGVVVRILRRADLADEVLQEAYLKVWNSAGQFDPAMASPITWMVAIARNRAIDLVRKKSEISIEEEPEVMEVAAENPHPLAKREMSEELKRLLACMGGLDEESRRLVLLAYYNGWEPPAAVWHAIKQKFPETTQSAPIRLPEIPRPPPPPPPRSLPSNVVELNKKLVRWHTVAAVTGTMAAALALFIATASIAPDV